MQHQILGADHRGAVQFSAKRHNRLLADHRIERRQVNQVVHVDRQRRKIEPRASIAKALHVRGIGHTRAPHARARGEDLKGIRAQFIRSDRGVFERFRARRMDADSQTAIVAKSVILNPR